MLNMLSTIVAAYFRYKVVSSVVIVACWHGVDQISFLRQLSSNNVRASFSCDLSTLDITNRHGLHGVLYFSDNNKDDLLIKTKREHFSTWYKWLVVGESIPRALHAVRYDADIALLKLQVPLAHNNTKHDVNVPARADVLDVYVHPESGASLHAWAVWTKALGMQLTHETQRIERRNNLNRYALSIATPNGLYTPEHYPGTFDDYVTDDKKPEVDSMVRCGYATAALLSDALNATSVLMRTPLWNSLSENTSMLTIVSGGRADLGGGVLRPQHERITRLDYITPIWPLSTGFTYIAERESSSNMYVEPFSAGVWVAFLGTGAVLAAALRLTATEPDERRDAFYSAVASTMQQDTNTVPQGVPGRAVFMTLSVFCMLVHAYYTSAVVSALMNSGRGGPQTVRALADSKLSIATEDYDWLRYSFFDAKSNWSDMEYLKEKKMTPSLYQPIERAVEMIGSGGTAYHTEYNNLYPLLNELPDKQLCKLQYIDTIPEIMTYIIASKWSQYANVASVKGAWLHETGLADRTLTKWLSRPPHCREALLAERVTFGDVAPLLTITAIGAATSALVLGAELLVANLKTRQKKLDSEQNLLTEMAASTSVREFVM